MRMHRIVFLCLCLFAGNTGHAQNMFMKIMDPTQVPGECIQQGFQNWTEVLAFNAGSTSEITSTGGGPGGPAPGRPVTKCFTISMRQDKAAYYLKKEMYNGSTITSIQFDFVKTNGSGAPETYYRVLLDNVLVSAIEEAGNEDGSSTMNVSFVPRKFRYTYWPQNSNGSLGTPVIFGWDNVANIPW